MPSAAALTIKVRATEIESVKAFLSAAIPALRAHQRGCVQILGRCPLCEALMVGASVGLVPGMRA